MSNPFPMHEGAVPLPVVELPRMSSSEEVAIKTCRLAHHFEYDLGYRPKFTNDKLDLGITYHEGLEVHHLGGTLEMVLARLDERSEERWEEIESVGLAKDASVRVEFIKARDLVAAMVENYISWSQEVGIDDDWDIVSVEEKLYIEVPGAATMMPMKMDLLQRNKRTGRLRIVDHKTRASFSSDVAPYQFAEQNGNYALGVFAAYGEVPTEMAYREARKMAPQTNPKSKPPYFREITVALTVEEMKFRAAEYARVSHERMDPDRAIYANPGACCGSWKNDWREPCLLVHQGYTPLEALEASPKFAPSDAYARYTDPQEVPE